MKPARVLVVDDSAAMRALFCDILDQAKGVEVVGTASSAAEARDKIPDCRPNVLTLDVEMPGMTGMEFLAELMEEDPIAVVMLSSVAQDGSGTAAKALALGAVDCFPKPLHTSPEEFKKTVAKLGSIVQKAANTDMEAHKASLGAGGGATAGAAADYDNDGRLVLLAAGSDSLETVRSVIAAMPANCPPTVILLDADEDVVERAVDRLRPSVACKIENAEDGAMVMPGTVYLAYDKSKHIAIEDDFALMIKLVDRDPVAGFRPSADLMFASAARAGCPTLAGMLEKGSDDGAKGLMALGKTGAQVFLESGSNGTAAGLLDKFDEVATSEVPDWLLGATAKGRKAA
ncbi:chemotaxis protein CheB [Aurantiacibacter suaedae]|uniref:chemotaxis protein CheB n=1 Tax=Aurantiacibacter suaedae TaxID=2545755 RepID=UPI0010F8CF3A|nr:chemotaxis protein CheB [Aurantiacibacter suaedae]